MKTKKTLSVISLLITCVISFTLAFSVAPKTNAFASTVTDIVFSDNFQGDISDKWYFARKNGVTYAEDGVKKNMWPTQNGKVVFSQKEYGKMFYGTADMTNYTFTVKVRADVNETLNEYLETYNGTNIAAGMTMNYNIPFFVNDIKKTTTNSAGATVIDNNTFYGRSVCFNNYAIGFFQFGGPTETGWAGSTRIVTKFATGFDWREWHTIKVVATAEKCDLYLDDVLMVSSAQSVFTKATGTSGYVGLTGTASVNNTRGEDYSTLYYDDFKVWGDVENEDELLVDASSFTVGQGVNPTYNRVENKLSFPTNSGTSIKLIDNTEHTDIKTSVKFDVDNQPETATKRTAKETTARSGLLLRASMTTGQAATTLKGYLINYFVRVNDGATIIWFRKYNSSSLKEDIDNNVFAKFTKAQAPTNTVWLDVWAVGSELGFTAYCNEQDFVNKTNGITRTITDTTHTSGSVGIFCDAGNTDYQRNFQVSFLSYKFAEYRYINGARLINKGTSIGYGVGSAVLNYDGTTNTVAFKDGIGAAAILDTSVPVSDFTTIVKLDLENQAKKTEIRTSADSGVLFRANLTNGNNDITGYYLQYYAVKTSKTGDIVNNVYFGIRKQSGQWAGDAAMAGSGVNITGTTTVWVRLSAVGSTISYTVYTSENDLYNNLNGKSATVTDNTYTQGYIGLKCNDGTAAKFDYEATFLPDTRAVETVMPEVDSFEMVNGASIRLKTDGSSGLRFTVGISKADYDNLAAYNPVFGAVLIPTDLKGAALTLDTAKVINITAPAELTLIDDVYYYNVSLLNIPEDSFGRAISARGYVKFTVKGVEYVYYTDYTAANNSRSIQEVAQKIIDSGKLDEFTVEQRDIIRRFAGVTFTQSNVAALGKAGGYPRIISLKNGEIFMTYSSKSAISTDNGVNFTNPLTAVTTTADPVEGENLKKGNLTPIELPNGNVAVFYRAIADGKNYYSSIRYKIYNVNSKTYGEEKIFLENYNPKNDTTGLWEPTPYFTASGELYVYVSVDISGSAAYNGIDSNNDLVCTGGYQNIVAVKCSVNGDEITVNGRQIVISGVNRNSRDGMNVITKLSDGSYAMVFEGTVNKNYRVFICYSKDLLNFTTPQQVFYNASYASGAPYIVTLPDGRIAVSYFTDEDYKGTPVEGYKGKVMRLYVSNSVVKYGDTLTKSNFTQKTFHTYQDTEYLSYGSMAVIGNRFFIVGCNGSNDESVSVKPLTYYINAYLL